MIENIETKYKKNKIYLVRNERHFALYSFDEGRRFEPDFVLFIQNSSDDIYYQIFIEPKGEFLKLKDKWKEDFLNQIKTNVKGTIKLENEYYKLLGLKFYDNANENIFRDQLKNELEI
jgi:type III restriction enzyme